MQIVSMLNTMFGMFDNLSDKNAVYKVNFEYFYLTNWKVLIKKWDHNGI